MKDIKDVTTAEEARDIAIDYSNQEPAGGISYGELAEQQNYFEALAEKFPELRQELEENGII